MKQLTVAAVAVGHFVAPTFADRVSLTAIDDPPLGDNTAVAERVLAEDSSWLVMHEVPGMDERFDTLGTVLGAAWVPSG